MKITEWLHALRVWLTADRRQAVHAALGTLAALGVTSGWLSDEQSTALLGFAGSALVLLQGALGLLLLRPSEAARWFDTTGRGLVYGLAAAAGAAGITFGFWGDENATQALALVSVLLTVASSFLGVVNVHTIPPGAPLTRRAYRAWIADQS